jgi:hypothetical protein
LPHRFVENVGHESVETTQIYDQADMPLKEKALSGRSQKFIPSGIVSATSCSPSLKHSDNAELPHAKMKFAGHKARSCGVIRLTA